MPWPHGVNTSGGRLDILCFHRIIPDGDKYFIPPMAINVKAFEKIVCRLASRGALTSLEQGVQDLSMGRLKGCHVAITLDDGYLDNFTVARQILRRYNAPATFFVPIAHIDEQRPFWWDVIRDISSRRQEEFGKWFARTASREFPPADSQPQVDPNVALTPQGCRELIQILNGRDKSTRDRFMLALMDKFGPYDGPRLLMNWSELSQLVTEGFEVGSHCFSHEPLTHLGLEEATREIQDSRDGIAQRVGKVPVGFSFPRGDYNEDLLSIVKSSGYKYSVTTRYGTNSGTDTYTLLRRNISDYRDWRRFFSLPCQLLELTGMLDPFLAPRRSGA